MSEEKQSEMMAMVRCNPYPRNNAENLMGDYTHVFTVLMRRREDESFMNVREDLNRIHFLFSATGKAQPKQLDRGQFLEACENIVMFNSEKVQ